MKKETNYIQCSMVKDEKHHHMAWIPEKFAVVGKFIKIKQDDDTWDDGWKVTGACGEVKKTSEEANAASQGHKKFGGSIR